MDRQDVQVSSTGQGLLLLPGIASPMSNHTAGILYTYEKWQDDEQQDTDHHLGQWKRPPTRICMTVGPQIS